MRDKLGDPPPPPFSLIGDALILVPAGLVAALFVIRWAMIIRAANEGEVVCDGPLFQWLLTCF